MRDAHPAARQHVEGRHRLREHDRVVVRQHDHRRVDDDARRRAGDEAHHRHRVRPRRAHEPDHVVRDHDVLGDRQRVEPELVGGARDELVVPGCIDRSQSFVIGG